MKIKLTNQPKLTLAMLLKRRKTTLKALLRELSVSTYSELLGVCERIGVMAPTNEEFNVACPFESLSVNDPMQGVIVIDPEPVMSVIKPEPEVKRRRRRAESGSVEETQTVDETTDVVQTSTQE